MYDYDAVGGFGRVSAACVGRGQALLQPLLDRLASSSSVVVSKGGPPPHVNEIGWEEAVELVKASYLSGGEREISIGDEMEIVVLLKGGKVIKDRIHLAKH